MHWHSTDRRSHSSQAAWVACTGSEEGWGCRWRRSKMLEAALCVHSLMGKWDGVAAPESLLLLNGISYWERAVSALYIVPKATLETLWVPGAFKDLKKPFLDYCRCLDHLLSQNREEQMKRGSFKIMRNIWRPRVENETVTLSFNPRGTNKTDGQILENVI